MHTHSDRSRESKIPGRLLLSLAKQNGLQGIGICEQDAFPDEMLYAHAAKLRLQLALGIEFSCKDSSIIGFGMDFSSKQRRGLEKHFSLIQKQMAEVVSLFVDRLRVWDSTVTLERIAAFAGKPPHPTFVLQYLVQERRMFPSLLNALQFIADENIGEVLSLADPFHPVEVVDLIHRAGGIAIWAHPMMTPIERQRPLMGELVEAGLDAVEVVYPYRENGYFGTESNEVLQARTLSLTKNFEILFSGGSDCKYPISPFAGLRPMLPGEYGITSQEADLFGFVFH